MAGELTRACGGMPASNGRALGVCFGARALEEGAGPPAGAGRVASNVEGDTSKKIARLRTHC